MVNQNDSNNKPIKNLKELIINDINARIRINMKKAEEKAKQERNGNNNNCNQTEPESNSIRHYL